MCLLLLIYHPLKHLQPFIIWIFKKNQLYFWSYSYNLRWIISWMNLFVNQSHEFCKMCHIILFLFVLFFFFFLQWVGTNTANLKRANSNVEYILWLSGKESRVQSNWLAVSACFHGISLTSPQNFLPKPTCSWKSPWSFA